MSITINQSYVFYLPLTTEEVYVFARTPALVCLSVCLCARLLKNACVDLDEMYVSTDVGTWTNGLTFEPDPDHSLDARTGFISPIAYALQRGNVEFYYVGKIPCAYWYWGPVEANTVVRGKNALPRALLVIIIIINDSIYHVVSKASRTGNR